MGKHKKHLREEKSKVKLKKKLPKGHNITDTAFKVKKILIADQLPDHMGVPVTFKHQTLQECLNYLTHHNVAKQVDGLKGIKELYRAKKIPPSSLEFKQVVTRILDVAVEDRESKVRRTAIKLLTDIINSLPNIARLPFTELLNKQLQRALSNINTGIQTDGLHLVDLVLSITPEEDSQTRQPLIGLLLRMLTMTGAQAPPRAAVLRRLLSVCRLVFVVPEERKDYFVSVPASQRVWPLTSTYKQVANLPLSGGGIINTIEGDVKELIGQIMKVSVGVWTEISTDKNVSKDVAGVLSWLVELALLLYRFAVKDSDSLGLKSWFVESFKELVDRNLLQKFPYLGKNTPSAQTNGNSNGNRQPDLVEEYQDAPAELVQLNLHLATLYFYLQPKQNLLPKVMVFLPSALAVRPVTNDLISLLDCLMRVKTEQKTVVAGVAAGCITAPDPRLSDWLQTIALDPHLQHCHQLDIFQGWVSAMVKDPAHSATVALMASRNLSTQLTTTLKTNARDILHSKYMDKNLVHALYWVCTPEKLLKIAEGCPSNTLGYLKSILQLT